jgi:hypothetical protein
MKSISRLCSLSLMGILGFAKPASAAEPQSALFAGYWSGFVEHWGKVFQQQDGISMAIVGLGVVAIFIITRGKWKK